MARKIKFALEMADGAKIRGDIDELREHFDLESVVRYFLSGKLVEWLDDRYYEDEAEALEKIDKDASDFHQELCEVLGVEYKADDDLDVAALERLNEKRAILRQKTADEEIIKNASKTALTQEDLADLLDMDEPLIYLCGEKFNVPIRVERKEYIGVLGKPIVTIKAKSQEELDAKKIVFKNVILPWTESKMKSTTIAKSKATKTRTKTATVKRKAGKDSETLVKSSELVKKNIAELLNWVESEKTRGWENYGLWFIYPASIDDSTESDIRSNIRSGAKEFLRNLRDDMKSNFENKIYQLNEAQKLYNKILKQKKMCGMEIKPSLQDVRKKIEKTLENLYALEPPGELENALVKIARYDKQEDPGFSGVFGGTVTVLANENALVKAADFYAKKCYEGMSKSDAGKIIQKYLDAMEKNLKVIVDEA